MIMDQKKTLSALNNSPKKKEIIDLDTLLMLSENEPNLVMKYKQGNARLARGTTIKLRYSMAEKERQLFQDALKQINKTEDPREIGRFSSPSNLEEKSGE